MKIESQGILIKGSYCISREPFKMSAGEIWLDSSEIQSIEAIPINGVYGDHPEFLRGGALVAVCNTGASFVLGIFNKHKYNLIANLADAVKAKEKLEKFLGQRFNEVDKIKEAERSIPEIGIRWTAETTIEDVRKYAANWLEESLKKVDIDKMNFINDPTFETVVVATETSSGNVDFAFCGDALALLELIAGAAVSVMYHIEKGTKEDEGINICKYFIEFTQDLYRKRHNTD